jgi:hypothetical protein
MNNVDYIVVNISKSLYQAFQVMLMDFSIKKVNQKGKLVVIVSDEMNAPSINLPSDAIIMEFPDWSFDWKEEKNDRYFVSNRHKSLEILCNNNYFNDSDNLLFVDPDMIFINPISFIPSNNQVIGQSFTNGFHHLKGWEHYTVEKTIRYPFLTKFSTLKTIIKEYNQFSNQIRIETDKWEADMWGLSYALSHHKINITSIDDLGTCNDWNDRGRKTLGNIIHYCQPVLSEDNKMLFFKQFYINNPDKNIDLSLSKNKTDNLLLTDVNQHEKDYLYYLKYNFSNLFQKYNGSNGYVIYKPWNAGFNNIRMSFELALCLSYLSNRTLVLPPDHNICFMGDRYMMDMFFNIDNIGIKHISFKDFCKFNKIEESYESVKNISKTVDFCFSQNVLNFESETPPDNFVKYRKTINSSDVFTERNVFFNGNLLGISHQSIYTKLDKEIKQLIAKHSTYKVELFDSAWQFINKLGDKQYYSLHVRRNDFTYCYPSSTTDSLTLLENVKDIIPLNSIIYISTDEKDKEYFKPLSENYTLFYYDDILPKIKLYNTIDISQISLIEQLICSRAIKFIGTKTSTMSSYINKIRGYMDDIEDKNYYIVTEKFNENKQINFIDDNEYDANFVREYKDNWENLN